MTRMFQPESWGHKGKLLQSTLSQLWSGALEATNWEWTRPGLTGRRT
ncbi:hypothetical protein CK203_013504 [Vitis vinifera]|uniref:Uncharacterized protein n=1 Tax=Vitis vinifera TaxID=29760 RepID=A0A438J930_VITVI|nr:hypothetical protein CK203_013504 [Vitis vinifera]